MVDFICMGLLELQGMRRKNYKLKNSCAQWDSSSAPSAYEADALPIAPQNIFFFIHNRLKFNRALPVTRGRSRKKYFVLYCYDINAVSV